MSTLFRLALLTLTLAFGLATSAVAQQKPPTKLQGFPTAEAAAEALTEAIRKNDDKAVSAILGVGWNDLLPGNDEDDDKLRADYLAAWDANHKVIPDGDNKDRMLIEAGTTGWRAPIPIVKDGDVWRFDIEAGKKEIIARAIGRNELGVVQTLMAVVDAQHEYVDADPMKYGVPTYARRLLSTPGKKDGLYWEGKENDPKSPLGPLVAEAQKGGVNDADGYYGYRFRLLYRQGPAAKGGAHEYLINGRMVGGFGVIAWPVKYGETGVMTFIVNQDGDVYENDLGPDTEEDAAKITSFNPDKDWEKADMTP